MSYSVLPWGELPEERIVIWQHTQPNTSRRLKTHPSPRRRDSPADIQKTGICGVDDGTALIDPSTDGCPHNK
jgi:hypothetical protein